MVVFPFLTGQAPSEGHPEIAARAQGERLEPVRPRVWNRKAVQPKEQADTVMHQHTHLHPTRKVNISKPSQRYLNSAPTSPSVQFVSWKVILAQSYDSLRSRGQLDSLTDAELF